MSKISGKELNKDHLQMMVVDFYMKVLEDDLIGPIFKGKLGDDLGSKRWQFHITLIRDFWAAIALGDKAYNRSPLSPHLKLPNLEKAHFQRWLKLFHETTDSYYEPYLSSKFKERSTIVAGNFMRNLKLGEL